MSADLTWLTLPADVASLAAFTGFVRGGGQAAGLSEGDLGRLDLILEELLVNIARYAYPEGAAGTSDVGYSIPAPGEIFVRICDSGGEYNPLDKNPPDFARGLADRPIGGLGLYLIKSYADSLSYARESGRNILSFVFRAKPGG
jgi:anti-sigma regulatory factor (Ser/Thr protein kinase)